MLKPQHYYYEDVVFQLELNLQTVRRELIDLLEEHTHDCIHCKKLKCSCVKKVYERSMYSLFQHDMKSISSTSMDFRIPPPANTLPKPKWTNDNYTCNKKPITKLRSWIGNSKKDSKHSNSDIISIEDSCTWPPFPKSIWSVESRVDNERDNSDEESVSSVQNFFRYFTYQSNSMNSSRT